MRHGPPEEIWRVYNSDDTPDGTYLKEEVALRFCPYDGYVVRYVCADKEETEDAQDT